MKNGNTLPHIIVTEKDAARLIHNPHLTNEIKQNLYYLPLKICFLQDQGTAFDAQIKDVITKNRKNYIPKTIKTFNQKERHDIVWEKLEFLFKVFRYICYQINYLKNRISYD